MLIDENKKWLKIFIPIFIILLCFVVATVLEINKGIFANPDKKARSLYNKALLTWTENKPQKALTLLDKLIAQFPKTKTASKAIITRQNYHIFPQRQLPPLVA